MRFSYNDMSSSDASDVIRQLQRSYYAATSANHAGAAINAGCFDTEKFRFHGPDGFEVDYAGLTNYFKSIAFDHRSIPRGIIIVEGDYVACQTWIEGRFAREFTQSPVGPPASERPACDLGFLQHFSIRR
ncbi:hypothetical protein [Mesorhizobium sp. Cs1321R2N1]|uniref:hypothetical protein n=1 Tax=Mesorhizobium sp. Cs1321R2N1 TaxID=3015174 RepID=UPI00301E2455